MKVSKYNSLGSHTYLTIEQQDERCVPVMPTPVRRSCMRHHLLCVRVRSLRCQLRYSATASHACHFHAYCSPAVSRFLAHFSKIHFDTNAFFLCCLSVQQQCTMIQEGEGGRRLRHLLLFVVSWCTGGTARVLKPVCGAERVAVWFDS